MTIVKIYNYTSDTYEFISASDGYIDEDTPLIPYCTEVPVPVTKEGFAAIFNNDTNEWEYKADYRGQKAYHTETGEEVNIGFIGEIEPLFTKLEPKTEFDKWNGKKWVTDTAAQKAALVTQAEQEKAQRLEEANATITYLQDAIEVGLNDDDYQAQLTAWKTYRVLLNRVDTSLVPNIDWPEKQ
ncbi:tail fiber assembly protein [Providencia rettgeri]